MSGTGATMLSPDGPLPTEGHEARKLLEEIRGKIPRYLEGELPDEATLDEWRARPAAIIAAPAAAAGRNP